MPINDWVDSVRSVVASKWANGKITLNCRMNTTAAITSASAYLVDMGYDGWVASTLALTTGTKLRYLGVSERAVAASTAALLTRLDLVVGGPTDIITTALPTTGNFVQMTTGAGIVYSASNNGIGNYGVWTVTSTSVSAAKTCLLFGVPQQMTS